MPIARWYRLFTRPSAAAARACLLVIAALSLLFVAGCAKTPNRSNAKRDTQTLQPKGAQQSGAAADGANSKAKTACKPSDADCQQHLETALLAGGCFWGMEELLREVPGVVDTEVGYTGGNLSTPRYEDVKQGNSGHAESVRVVFDRRVLKYEELLERWFFRMHDPTTENRQGNDRGSQYRSAIFTLSKAQHDSARAVIKRVEASGKWSDSVVTEVVDAGPFTPAEGYHQDYLQKSPDGYTCHYLRD